MGNILSALSCSYTPGRACNIPPVYKGHVQMICQIIRLQRAL